MIYLCGLCETNLLENIKEKKMDISLLPNDETEMFAKNSSTQTSLSWANLKINSYNIK